MKNLAWSVESASDVRCKAVGRMQGSHVPEQQPGLIVGFAVHL